MKITIDFENKVLYVNENIRLVDFFKNIKKILPDWKEYTLEINYVYCPYYTNQFNINDVWYKSGTGEVQESSFCGTLTTTEYNTMSKW